MPGANAAVVRRWFEGVWNRREEDLIDDLIMPESVCYADDGPIRGPEEFRLRQYVPFLTAFPDLRVDVEDVIEEGDQVAVRWSAAGTHTGEGIGAATGRRVTFRGLSWVRVRDGKMVEGWQSSNIPETLLSLRGSDR